MQFHKTSGFLPRHVCNKLVLGKERNDDLMGRKETILLYENLKVEGWKRSGNVFLQY